MRKMQANIKAMREKSGPGYEKWLEKYKEGMRRHLAKI